MGAACRSFLEFRVCGDAADTGAPRRICINAVRVTRWRETQWLEARPSRILCGKLLRNGPGRSAHVHAHRLADVYAHCGKNSARKTGPREAIDGCLHRPKDRPLSGLINAVSFTARNQENRIASSRSMSSTWKNRLALRKTFARFPGIAPHGSVRYFATKHRHAAAKERNEKIGVIGAGICSCAQPRGNFASSLRVSPLLATY